jgi:hypothetical protein
LFSSVFRAEPVFWFYRVFCNRLVCFISPWHLGLVPCIITSQLVSRVLSICRRKQSNPRGPGSRSRLSRRGTVPRPSALGPSPRSKGPAKTNR